MDTVLILVVVDDGLVLGFTKDKDGNVVVLILVVVDNGLVHIGSKGTKNRKRLS